MTDRIVFDFGRTARGAVYRRTIEIQVPSGVTVETNTQLHSAVHTPPAGGTVSHPTLTVLSPKVTFTWTVGSAAADVGNHTLDFVIKLTDGQKRACRCPMEVTY